MLHMPSFSPTTIPNGCNVSNNEQSPPPLDLLGGLEGDSHRITPDPGDPGPVHPLTILASAFDTPNIQALNALKAQVEVLADMASIPFHQSRFQPRLTSPDFAGAALSPASSTLSWTRTSCTSPDNLFPTPTSSSSASGSLSSPSSFGSPPSAYSREDYYFPRPFQVLDLPALPPSTYPHQGGQGYPIGQPSPHLDPGYGLHPSAFSLSPLAAMAPEPAMPSTTCPFAALPTHSGYSESHAARSRLYLPQHAVEAQNPQEKLAPSRVQAVCPECGREFTHKKNLKPHLREQHGPDRPRYYCLHPHCTANYLRKSDLSNHMNEKHSVRPDT